MDNIYWGSKQTEYVSNDDTRKRKLVQVENELIYRIGNEVHFTSEINKNTIELLIKLITEIIYENKKSSNFSESEKLTITYIVDSPGGCVTSILKFVDFINLTKEKNPDVEFVSIATGLIASAATIMCIVADKRYMTKNAHAMIHELSAGKSGKYTHIVSHTDFLTKLHTALLNIYVKRSGRKDEDLEDLLADETWFSAQQYLEYGFIDQIK
jgi:ATP-dependent protease ClpP protease subunit